MLKRRERLAANDQRRQPEQANYEEDRIYPTFAAAATALCRFIAACKLPIPDILDTRRARALPAGSHLPVEGDHGDPRAAPGARRKP
jgi:hypothetical protein